MIENPGPLAELDNNPASNFTSGKYNVETLAEDTVQMITLMDSCLLKKLLIL